MENLNDAECGRLWRACLEYSKSGTLLELRGNERILFPSMKSQIDRDIESYKSICDTNKQNGSLGGQATATERYRTLPNAPRTPPKDKTKEKDKTKDNTKDESGAAAPVSDFDKAFSDFRDMRKKIKAPMAPKAETLILSELQKLAGDDEPLKIAVLNQSVEKSWRGVFPLNSQKAKPYATAENHKRTVPTKAEVQQAQKFLERLRAEE